MKQSRSISWIFRALTAVGLIGIAAVHLDIAKNYKGVGKNPLSIEDQFYAQAAIAIVLIIALIVKPHVLVWAATALFAIGSLAVLVYSRYHGIPVYGIPSPGFQEPWSVKGAKLAAVSEGAAIVFALAGGAFSRSRMSTSPQPATTSA